MTALRILVVCCLAIILNFTAEAETNTVSSFSHSWSPSRPDGVNPSLLVWQSHGSSYVPQMINYYFEPDALHKNAHLQFHVDTRDNTYSNMNKNVDPPDCFYCEQAIWEASPCSSILNAFVGTCDFKARQSESDSHFSCKSLYLKHHPQLNDQTVVVIHVIPCCADNLCSAAVQQNELHTLSNLKAIRLEDIHTEQFLSFRKEWIDFFKAHEKQVFSGGKSISRKELFDKADELIGKYSSLFIPG